MAKVEVVIRTSGAFGNGLHRVQVVAREAQRRLYTVSVPVLTIQKCATMWTLDEHSSHSFRAPRDDNLARALGACIRKTRCNAASSLGDQFFVNRKDLGR